MLSKLRASDAAAQKLRKAVGRRLERSRAHWSARSSSKHLDLVTSKGSIETARVVLVSVIRNDATRLPFWLRYYKDLGVDHFLIIDNGSVDDSMAHLLALNDVTVYRTEESFRQSKFGMDWVNFVADKHCRGKWVLHVDSDEFLSFDRAEAKQLSALVDLLISSHSLSFQCMLLDLYSERPTRYNFVSPDENPFDVCNLFDDSGYRRRYDPSTYTTWVTGGVRHRLFFGGALNETPALNKSPLVFWGAGVSFVQSAHRLAPKFLNAQSASRGLTGILLHQRFLEANVVKMRDSAHVSEHNSEYLHYSHFGDLSPFKTGLSRRYRSSEDLVACGLMSGIDWRK